MGRNFHLACPKRENILRPKPVLPELLQKSHIALKEQLQVIEAILQHGDAIGPHPKSKTRDSFRVVTVMFHELEHVRIDHAAAENFYPSCPFTGPARFLSSLPRATANKAGHEHLCARLGEGEKRWAKAGFHLASKQR